MLQSVTVCLTLRAEKVLRSTISDVSGLIAERIVIAIISYKYTTFKPFGQEFIK